VKEWLAREVILFSGHRNKVADPEALLNVLAEHPKAVWLHGGAMGFDTQVADFAVQQGIVAITVAPDYKRYGKQAPLIRNCFMVRVADAAVFCYDGRRKGGTFYTINRAREAELPVIRFLVAYDKGGIRGED
jgi:hypothetical protein